MVPVSEAHRRAVKKNKEKSWKRIPLDVRVEEYEELKDFTEKTGQSINGFLRKIIKENIKST